MARLEYVFWEEGELKSVVAEPMWQEPLLPVAGAITMLSIELVEPTPVFEAICAMDDVERSASSPDAMTTLDKILTQVFDEGMKCGRRESKMKE